MNFKVSEVFASIHGEGWLAGTPCVFVRFYGCNLNCTVDSQGWDCDTPRKTYMEMDAQQIMKAVHEAGPAAWVVLTGGEPCLQITEKLVKGFKAIGRRVAVETNGTIDNPALASVDRISCSPKPGHETKLKFAHEVRYVLQDGKEVDGNILPEAFDYYVSPVHDGNACDPKALAWCIEYVMRGQRKWKLSMQQHKQWGIR